MAHENESRELAEIGCGGGYSSEFDEHETTARNKTWRDDGLSGIKRKSNSTVSLPSKGLVSFEYSREEGRIQKHEFLQLDAYSRHKRMMNDYVLYYGKGIEHFKRDSLRDKSDLDVIKQEHRFLWKEKDNSESTWEKHLAKKYYEKLFREYCISDLRYYKENKIALRWRIEKEVVDGKGQFICGDKRCAETEGLRSWEVNFGYSEHGEKKSTLIKLRLCPDCSYKLNYKKQKKLSKKRWKGKCETEKTQSGSETKKRKTSNTDEGHSQFKEDYINKDHGAVSAPLEALNGKGPEREGHSIWKFPGNKTVEKTREEEFEDYFQDMFL